MRKIFATVITSLVFSLFIFVLSGCGNDYSVIREDPEYAEEKEAALEILNEKVQQCFSGTPYRKNDDDAVQMISICRLPFQWKGN